MKYKLQNILTVLLFGCLKMSVITCCMCNHCRQLCTSHMVNYLKHIYSHRHKVVGLFFYLFFTDDLHRAVCSHNLNSKFSNTKPIILLQRFCFHVQKGNRHIVNYSGWKLRNEPRQTEGDGSSWSPCCLIKLPEFV